MERWDLTTIETPGGTLSPVVLQTNGMRAVLLGFEPGQELGDHQVKEHAWIVVLEGEVEVEHAGEQHPCRPGSLLLFDPDERHAVRSAGGAKILLLLSPWPGEGHYWGGPPAAA